MAVLEKGQFSTDCPPHRRARPTPTSAAIVEGQSGRLWVGTENGLFEIGGASRARSSFNVEWAPRWPHADIIGRSLRWRLWIGTADGTAALRRRTLRCVRLCAPAMPTCRSPRSTKTPDGTPLDGNGNGARYRRAGDSFERHRASRPPPASWFACCRRDHDGNWDRHPRGRPGALARRPVQRAGEQSVRHQRSDARYSRTMKGVRRIGSYGVGLLRLHDAEIASAGEPEGLQGN